MEHSIICGMDEVGRGALAGPVCVVALLTNTNIPAPIGINDSKKLTKKKRIALAEIIKSNYIYSIGFVMPETIDRINILQATMLAMQIAVNRLPKLPIQNILIDGNKKPDNLPYPATTIIKGDEQESSIMMASILAKVIRDDYMTRMHHYYPVYGFNQHSGYPTTQHKNALRQFGLSPIHRRSFKF